MDQLDADFDAFVTFAVTEFSEMFAWLRAVTYARRVRPRVCASRSLRNPREGEILGPL
jgi:hypothetical protein